MKHSPITKQFRKAGALLALLLLAGAASQAAISVGPSGSANLTFDSLPAVADWSTLNIAGGGADVQTTEALNTRIQQVAASTVNTVLGTSGSLPPTGNAIARWNNNASGFFLQTKPTGNNLTLLMATLQNNSGEARSSLTIQYDQGIYDQVSEALPGWSVYYSFSGEANSWVLINDLSGVNTAGGKVATLSVGSWAVDGLLYLLWVDDNNDGNTDPANTIDNFSVVFGQSPPAITQQPVSTNVLQCTTTRFSVQAAGSLPLTYRWYHNGQAIDEFFQNATAINPTLVITNVGTGDGGTYYCVVTGVIEPPATSSEATLTVTADTTPPTMTRALLNADGSLLSVTFSEAVDGNATDRFSYELRDSTETTFVNFTDGSGVKTSPTTVEWTITPPIATSTSWRLVYTGGGTATADTCNGNALEAGFIPVITEVRILSNDAATLWRYYDVGDQDLAASLTTTAYDDSAWKQGAGAFDNAATTIGGEPVRTPLIDNLAGTSDNVPTYYFRKHFTFPANPTSPNSRLEMRILYDDGANVYINGQFAASFGAMPATRPTTWNAYTALGTVGTAAWGAWAAVPMTNVVQGDNVIAVEVKQANATSSDAAFALELRAQVDAIVCVPFTITRNPVGTNIVEGQSFTLSVETTGTGISYQWKKNGANVGGNSPTYSVNNAVPGDGGSFTVEVVNNCTVPATTPAVTVTVGADTVKPTVVSAGGDYDLQTVYVSFSKPVSVASAQNPANYVLTPGGNATSATLAANGTNVTVVTPLRTFGTTSTLTIQNIQDTRATPNTIVTTNVTIRNNSRLVVPFSANSKYYTNGSLDGIDWKSPSYVEDANWYTGPGAFGNATAAVSNNIAALNMLNPTFGTAVPRGTNDLTLYFRQAVTLPALPTNPNSVRLLRYSVDDGLVAYVNGTELGRYNMTNSGAITYSTLALAAADEEEVWSFPLNLGAGTHTVAVEVHQSSATSSDVVFATEVVDTIRPSLNITQNSAGDVIVTWAPDRVWNLVSSSSVTGTFAPVGTADNIRGIYTSAGNSASTFYKLMAK